MVSGTSSRAKLDPAEFRPELAPDIEVREFKLRWGNDYAMIANPRDLLHYQLAPGEMELLPLMDGTRTVKEIVVERFRESGDIELSAVADLVRQLQVGNFLTSGSWTSTASSGVRSVTRDAGACKARAVRQDPVRSTGRTRTSWWTGSTGTDLRFFFIPGVARRVGRDRGRRVRGVRSVYRIGPLRSRGVRPPPQSLFLLGMNYFLTFMHELGHAVVLVHYGRRVKSAGFMIYFGSPAFFVESSDGLMLDRRQRIVQSFAGPYAELVVSGASRRSFVWAFPDGRSRPSCTSSRCSTTS